MSKQKALSIQSRIEYEIKRKELSEAKLQVYEAQQEEAIAQQAVSVIKKEVLPDPVTIESTRFYRTLYDASVGNSNLSSRILVNYVYESGSFYDLYEKLIITVNTGDESLFGGRNPNESHWNKQLTEIFGVKTENMRGDYEVLHSINIYRTEILGVTPLSYDGYVAPELVNSTLTEDQVAYIDKFHDQK